MVLLPFFHAPDHGNHQHERHQAAYGQKDAKEDDSTDTEIALLMPFLEVHAAGLCFKFVVSHVSLPASPQSQDHSPARARVCLILNKRRRARFLLLQWERSRTWPHR